MNVSSVTKASESDAQQYYTYEEAAKYLGITYGTLKTFVGRGLFKSIKASNIGRHGATKYINREQLDWYHNTFGTKGRNMPEGVLPEFMRQEQLQAQLQSATDHGNAPVRNMQSQSGRLEV